jgi:hypothetical protein
MSDLYSQNGKDLIEKVHAIAIEKRFHEINGSDRKSGEEAYEDLTSFLDICQSILYWVEQVNNKRANNQDWKEEEELHQLGEALYEFNERNDEQLMRLAFDFVSSEDSGLVDKAFDGVGTWLC